MKKNKILYEPEDDVLNIWVSRKHIDFAEEAGGMIIHFTKNNEPVYIEILNASKFLKETAKSFPKKVQEEIFSHISPHI